MLSYMIKLPASNSAGKHSPFKEVRWIYQSCVTLSPRVKRVLVKTARINVSVYVANRHYNSF